MFVSGLIPVMRAAQSLLYFRKKTVIRPSQNVRPPTPSISMFVNGLILLSNNDRKVTCVDTVPVNTYLQLVGVRTYEPRHLLPSTYLVWYTRFRIRFSNCCINLSRDMLPLACHRLPSSLQLTAKTGKR